MLRIAHRSSQFIIIGAMLTATVIFSPNSTAALSCAQPNPDDALQPLQHMQQSTYVFAGTVGSATRQSTDLQADYIQDVQVSDWVKGSTGEQTVTYRSNGTWSAPLEAGTKALFVYSNVTMADDEYNISGKTEFDNPLCPGPNPAVLSTDHSDYADYTAAVDQVRDDSQPPASPQPPTPPTFGAGLSFIGIVVSLLLSFFWF